MSHRKGSTRTYAGPGSTQHLAKQIQREFRVTYSVAKTAAVSQLGVQSGYVSTELVMIVRTTANAEAVQIAAIDSGTFDAVIDWGDGSTSVISAFNDADLDHTYALIGYYQVSISGSFPTLAMSGGDPTKVYRVLNIGATGLTSLANAFNGCTNLGTFTFGGADSDSSAVTSFASMFEGCTGLTNIDLRNMETSLVTTMESMFKGCTTLVTIAGLSAWAWNVNSVTDFGEMFSGCTALTTLDPSGWDTAGATKMDFMFLNCAALTSVDVTGFDMIEVTTVASMFSGCTVLTDIDPGGWVTTGLLTGVNMVKN